MYTSRIAKTPSSATRIAQSLSLGLLAAVPMLLAGCIGPRVTQPMRAIWVTRSDYRTPEDVGRIVNNCADAGFNTILFQVRGNATVFYRSDIEPWAEQFEFQDPGFDPLALAIEEARQRGVELHAWVNVMPAWRGTTPPAEASQIYNTRPEWFWYDQNGNRQQLSSFYVSLNPCLPEVREYLVDVYRELVSRYDVDGLHLDYIRFPNEPPATPRGSDVDYPYDERTLALFKAETGKTPQEDPAAWDQWRTDQVTRLVTDIHDMLRRTRPRIPLTTAVGSVRENGLRHFQDAKAWMKNGLVDAVILMDYVDEPKQFGERIDPWLEIDAPVPVVPGLWFGRHRGQTVEEAVGQVKEEIEIARQKTGDFCIFSYAGLFDTREREPIQQRRQSEDVRAKRREILLPYLREIARSE